MTRTDKEWLDTFKQDLAQAMSSQRHPEWLDEMQELLNELQNEYDENITHLIDELKNGALTGESLELFGHVILDMLENERCISYIIGNGGTYGPQTLEDAEALHSEAFVQNALKHLHKMLVKYTFKPLLVTGFSTQVPNWVHPKIHSLALFEENEDGTAETSDAIRMYVTTSDGKRFMVLFLSSLKKRWMSDKQTEYDWPRFYSQIKTIEWPVIGRKFTVDFLSADCLLVDNKDGTWSIES